MSGGVQIFPSVPPSAMSQFNWFIDAVNGNDANDGATSLTAIRTDEERQRRMGPSPLWNGTYHLRYLSDIATAYWGGVRTLDSAIFIHGSATNGQGQSVLFTGVVDALVAQNPAANQPFEVTSSAIPVSWTASGLVGSRVRLTSGANAGAKSWVMKDLGGAAPNAKARCCDFGQVVAYTAPMTQPTAQAAPTATNGFVVERLTKITQCTMAIVPLLSPPFGTAPGVTFESLDLGTGGFLTIACADKVLLDGCIWKPSSVQNSGNVTCTNVQLASGSTLGSGFQQIQMAFGYVPGNVTFNCLGSAFQNFMSQGGAIEWRSLANNHLGNGQSIGSRGVAVFDNTTGIGCVVVRYGGAILLDGILWGAGNTVPIGFFGSGCRLDFATSTAAAGAGQIPIASTSPDFSMQTRTSVPAFDQTTSLYTAVRALSPANVFATVAAGGFGGSVVDPVTGCGIGNSF